MKEYEVRNGTGDDATCIGRVVASSEIEAISTLNAYRNGFKMTEPGEVGPPNAHVVWAHPDLERLSSKHVPYWRARPVDGG